MSASTLALGRLARCRSGGGAAEFALCLPILVLLVLGLFELGWTQHCLSNVRFSLETASRHLQLHPDADQAAIRAVVLASLDDLAGQDIQITLARQAAGPTGQMGVITAVYQRQIGIPGMATMPLRHTVSVKTPLSNL